MIYLSSILVILTVGLVTLLLFTAYLKKEENLSFRKDLSYYMLFLNIKIAVVIVHSFVNVLQPEGSSSTAMLFLFLRGLSSLPLLFFLYRFTLRFFDRTPSSLENRMAVLFAILLGLCVLSLTIFLSGNFYSEDLYKTILLIGELLFFCGLLFNLIHYFLYEPATPAREISAIVTPLMRAALVFFPLLILEDLFQSQLFGLWGIPEKLDLPYFSTIYYLIFNGGFLIFLYRHILLRKNLSLTGEYRLNAFCEEYSISSRETEIIGELLSGKQNKEIGESLFISPETVRNHLSRIYRKTEVKNRLELISLLNKFSN